MGDSVALLEVKRGGRILTKAQFGCLKDAYTLNVTRGCEFQCVYCYARGYPGAPPCGEVHVYVNFPQKLAQELDNPRRRSPVQWVLFNTASDSFQTHPVVLDTTYQSMRVLLERGIGFSFLTKGWIPDRFVSLFADYPGAVMPRIGLVSLELSYRNLFEPYAAASEERLANIERLKAAGMEVEIRVDPIIPFYTDDNDSILRLLEALAERQVQRISLSYLHLRPAILEQLRKELPPRAFHLLRSCFQAQSWRTVGTSSRSKLVPLPLREQGYRRFVELSRDFGITSLICSCKNPDMSAHQCASGRGPSRQDREGQLSLFPC